MGAKRPGPAPSELPREERRFLRGERAAIIRRNKLIGMRLARLAEDDPDFAKDAPKDGFGEPLEIAGREWVAAAMGWNISTLRANVRDIPKLRRLLCPNGRYKATELDLLEAWQVHRAWVNMRKARAARAREAVKPRKPRAVGTRG